MHCERKKRGEPDPHENRVIGRMAELWYTGGMKIKFLGHSGFYVELEEAELLFDYSVGSLPDFHPRKPLFLFVSHAHADHFSKKIFLLNKEARHVFYILSDDIRVQSVPKELRKSVTFLSAGEKKTVSAGGDGNISLEVSAFRSTDEGVAFLLDIGGKRLYHAGDLNNWHWESEGDSWNDSQKKRYGEEMKRIAACVSADKKKVDAAFVPLDCRLGRFFHLGLDEYMRTVGAEFVFPMHFFGDSGVIEVLRRMTCAAPYADRILGTGTEGEEFSI